MYLNNFELKVTTRTRVILVEGITSFLEVVSGFLFVILLYPPIGSFNLNACFSSKDIIQDLGIFFYNIIYNIIYNLIYNIIYFKVYIGTICQIRRLLITMIHSSQTSKLSAAITKLFILDFHLFWQAPGMFPNYTFDHFCKLNFSL